MPWRLPHAYEYLCRTYVLLLEHAQFVNLERVVRRPRTAHVQQVGRRATHDPLEIHTICAEQDSFIRVSFVSRPLYTCIICVTTPLYVYYLCHDPFTSHTHEYAWVSRSHVCLDPFIRVSCGSRPLYASYTWISKSHVCRDSSIAYVQNVYVYEGAMCVATPICLIHMNIHKYEGVMCVATPVLQISRMSTCMKESCVSRPLYVRTMTPSYT